MRISEDRTYTACKKTAFTLAEVLITLGVIGVVAAMTLPTLIQSYKKQEYGAKLKKFNSVMAQAILRSEQDNDEAGEWIKDGGINGDIKDDEDNPDYSANANVVIKYINTYLKPYISIVELREATTDLEKQYGEAYMVFKDGSYLYLHNGNCVDFVYDLNGPIKPNEDGKDIFRYSLCSNHRCQVYPWFAGTCGKLYPLGLKLKSRQEELQNCKNNPIYCTRLLQLDNYEFKGDYPYRL